ncbi:hypothetical protein A2964_02995 [Candidatus Daviesbacteria bacterium RIFCSPLOWO2_01_FULL_40_27]|nr:MAG: hypothetical protein A2964_02995 [Candidatus Daviesbacteria bacterium RIFCSPLOWO2_01_FULL_40_27]
METRDIVHKTSGTDYGEAAAKAYASAKHGPDGDAFLDPKFLPELDKLNGKKVVDIGTGAGPWAIYAAEKGAKVVALDLQAGMLTQAKGKIAESAMGNNIKMLQADGAALPLDAESDTALSINVGCNLPNQSFVPLNEAFVGRDGQKIEVGFDKYFSEMARVLKGGGTGIVTAPTSFGEVFTSGRIPKEEAIKSINEALEKIGGNDDSKVIKEYLGKLDDIYRATFAKRDGKWTLIEDESLLQSGEEIWRKLPGLIVPNYYHVEQEYVDAFEKAGLNIVSTSRECFKTEEERLTYNSKVKSDKHLGPEYVGNVPFAVFIVEKPLAKAS